MKGRILFMAFGLGLVLSCGKEKGIFDLTVSEKREVKGIEDKVEVVRDEWGVVHIYAKNEKDLFFVQGYMQAWDRLFQMLLMRGLAKGELSIIIGSSTLPMDLSMRLFNLRGVAEKMWNMISDDEKELLQAYADGVNEFMKNAKPYDLPFELLVLGISNAKALPEWTPVDTLSFSRFMTFNLSFDDEGTFGNTYKKIQERLLQKYPGNITLVSGMLTDLLAFNINKMRSYPVRDVHIQIPQRITSSLSMGSEIPEIDYKVKIKESPALKNLEEVFKLFRGSRYMSNNWAIHGKISETGNPMIANDPHLSLTQPPVFHEEHLNTKKKGGDINAGGVIFPGAPGIVIGFTENIAWAETVVGYDVTDFYVEILSSPAKPWKVLRNGKWVDVVERNELIPFLPDGNSCSIPSDIMDELKEYPVDIGPPSYSKENGLCVLPVTIYEVEGHGPVVSAMLEETPPQIVTVRWTGFEPSLEIKTFLGYLKARDINDAKKAVKDFKVGAQNQLIIDRDGNIGWFPHARVPKRDITKCADPNFNPVPPHIIPPVLPMPGDGRCDWKGYIEGDELLSLISLENPDSGFIVTANNSPSPITSPYIGAYFDLGYRANRIQTLINEKLNKKGKINSDDLKEIQADAHSNTCDDFLPVLKEGLTDKGDKLNDDEKSIYSKYLKDWNCDTSSGYELRDGKIQPVKDEKVRNNAIATSIFHTWFANFVHDTFDDQTGESIPDQLYAMAIYHITFRPNCASNPDKPCQLTGDGSSKSSPFWDDINTSETETRDDIILKSFREAIAGLKNAFGTADPSYWLWGKIHKLILRHLSCIASCPPEIAILNVPSIFDPVYGSTSYAGVGFPRAGDQFVVDNSDPGLSKADENTPRTWTYSSGPSYRMVVEMTKEGPKAWTAIPGGNVARPKSKHYSDQIKELWWLNKYKEFPFRDEDVEESAEELIIFEPE